MGNPPVRSQAVAASPGAIGSAPNRHHPTARFWLARLGLIVLAVAIALSFAVSLAPYAAQVTTLCAHIGPCPSEQLTRAEAADLARYGVTLGAYAAFLVALQCAYLLVTLGVVGLLLWRRPADGFALFTAFTLLVWTDFVVGTLYAGQGHNPAMNLLDGFMAISMFPAFTLFFFLFPSGRFVSGRSRWLALGFVPLTLVAFLGAKAVGAAATLPVYLVLFIVWFGAIIAVQVRRYRRVSTPAQRQQTKWVVYGVAVALLAFIALLALEAVAGAASGLIALVNGLFYAFELLVPLSIGIAILRSHLYDIDIIIRRTLVYGIVTAALAAVYAVCVIGSQALAQDVTGQRSLPPVAVVASTLLIAALFQPLRHTTQSAIDRRFYRRKYNAERIVAQFAATLRDELDLEQVGAQLLAVVGETMQPEHVSLWLRPLEQPTAHHGERL